MHSSKNIPQASPTAPAITNTGDGQQAQPPVATERFWFELFTGCLVPLQTCSKREIYKTYRSNCRQTKCRPVALSTFYRRLRGGHHVDVKGVAS